MTDYDICRCARCEGKPYLAQATEGPYCERCGARWAAWTTRGYLCDECRDAKAPPPWSHTHVCRTPACGEDERCDIDPCPIIEFVCVGCELFGPPVRYRLQPTPMVSPKEAERGI